MGETNVSHKSDTDIAEILGIDQKGANHGRMRWRRWAFITVAAIALAGIAAYFIGGKSAQGMRYITEPVTRANLTVIVTATGSVQPTNKVDVSSELSGTIRRVLVDYNSRVTVGQQLAELDTDKLKANVDSARARLAAARAKIRDAEATVVEKKLDFERKQTLATRSVGSVHDLEVARAAYERSLASVETAKADTTAAEAELKLHETNFAKTCICSPINGVVLKRNVEPGQIVASTLQAPVLFHIAEDLSKMEVQVDVDEADIGKVREGQLAIFSVDAYPDRKFKARIRELRYGSEVIQGVVTYKAILETDNKELLLRPGMTATAEITVAEVAEALSIPNAALRYAPPSANDRSDRRSFIQKLLPGRPPFRPPSARAPSGPDRFIWVLEDDEPQQVRVKLGPTDGRRTQIIDSTIEAGQQVIVDTASRNRRGG
jgi:HlyD family secretion protein